MINSNASPKEEEHIYEIQEETSIESESDDCDGK